MSWARRRDGIFGLVEKRAMGWNSGGPCDDPLKSTEKGEKKLCKGGARGSEDTYNVPMQINPKML